MANLKQLRKRIHSVASTQKITKAMQLVSANKLNKANNNMEENYFPMDLADQMISQVKPFIRQTQLDKNYGVKYLILITSEKGLCGAYNSSISRLFRKDIASLKESGQLFEPILIGRKGKEMLKNLDDTIFYNNIEQTYDDLAEVIIDKISERIFTEGGQVVIYFNNYKNSISYINEAKPIWPLLDCENDDEPTTSCEIENVDYISLIKLYLKVNLINALISSSASELSARMVAMDNATRNAKKLIDELTITLNRSRQAIVTKELIEIISGAEAL